MLVGGGRSGNVEGTGGGEIRDFGAWREGTEGGDGERERGEVEEEMTQRRLADGGEDGVRRREDGESGDRIIGG